MNCPFTKKHIRILAMVLTMVMMTALLSGCFLTEDPDPSGESGPSPSLNLVDSKPTDGSEPDRTEDTKPEITVAYAAGQVNVQSRPGPDGKVTGYLSKGDKVQISKIEPYYGEDWAMVEEGWVAMSGLTTTPPEGTADPTDPDGTEPDATTPEETKPDETKPNEGTTTAKFNGVITASELNIRKSAGTNGEKVGMYKYGDRVSILETKDGWGRTDKGWISLTYVYQDGTAGTNACKGIVTGTQLNVRSGPGTNYDKVASYEFGDRVNVLQTFKIGDTTWGCTKDGWISMGYVYVDGTKGENAGTGTMTGDNVNIRSGPGTNYDRVGSLNKGDTVEILHQIKVDGKTWGCTSKGWVSMDYVEMDK